MLDNIFKALDTGTDSAMSSQLTAASGKLNEIAARVPALEDLGASGHLIFDGTTEDARASVDPYVRQFVHGLPDGPL